MNNNSAPVTLVKGNLSEQEKKNVFLAVACGALNSVNMGIPGSEKQRKKRELTNLSRTILKQIGPKLPRVKKHNIKLLEDTITASGVVLDKIMDEGQYNAVHILLNLVCFCLGELPTPKDIDRRCNNLFKLWDDAMKYEDIRAGNRIFDRIESEVTILVAQRGGAIL